MQDDAVPGATGELAYEIPTVHFACMYQPLDEIRDYFGDDNAIYFSWLATYTRALGFAGIWVGLCVRGWERLGSVVLHR